MTFDLLVAQMLRSKRQRVRLLAEHRRHMRAGTTPVRVTTRVLSEPLCGVPRRAARWVHQTTIHVRVPK